MNPSLSNITSIGKSDLPRAEALLINILCQQFPELAITGLCITPSALSLNSINGFLTARTGEYFFKFHAEEDEEKSLQHSEYYAATALAEAGLPLLKPLFASSKPGSQILIYPRIDAPTLYAELEREDIRFLEHGSYDDAHVAMLLAAEREYLKTARQVALQSLQLSSAAESAKSALHQLFSHRLQSHRGLIPRVNRFYRRANITLPGGEMLSFAELARLRWTINGEQIAQTLDEIITAAAELLQPFCYETVPTCLGHGDDHNGNKFIIDRQLIAFDPAFGGRQPALLSFVKATIHNTFLHPLWFYRPELARSYLEIIYRRDSSTIEIEHNWDLETVSPFRLQIRNLYRDEIWLPLLDALRSLGILPADWRNYLAKAFCCCPFLATNLIDTTRYSPEQMLFNLAQCMELGGKDVSCFVGPC